MPENLHPSLQSKPGHKEMGRPRNRQPQFHTWKSMDCSENQIILQQTEMGKASNEQGEN
jgi:hypothetical protein